MTQIRTQIRPLVAALAIGMVATLLGCGNSDAADAEDAGTVDPDSDVEPPAAPLAVDVLWVISQAKGMCDDQIALALDAPAIAGLFSAPTPIDYRMAAVTSNVLEQDPGRFQFRISGPFCFACARRIAHHCERTDPEACKEFGEGWTCHSPEKTAQITNCNGSVNSTCGPTCNEDSECDGTILGVDQGAACSADPAACRFKCLKPNGDVSNSGCVPLVPTADCPDPDALQAELRAGAGLAADATAYVVPQTAERLRCLMVPGSPSQTSALVTGGFTAPLLALAPTGPNHEQAAGFLREDAALLIVFVSDRDDCSLAEGRTLKKEQHGGCACLGDTTEGGPLLPVAEAAARLRKLKSNPDDVYVVAVVGDSLQADPAAVEAERVAYTKSKCSQCDDPEQMHYHLGNTSMCHTPERGRADYGRRFVELVADFGENGALGNLCSHTAVADTVGEILSRIRTQ